MPSFFKAIMEEDRFKRQLNNILIRARTLSIDMEATDNIYTLLDRHKHILDLVKDALKDASMHDNILMSKFKPRAFTRLFSDFLDEYQGLFAKIDNELKELLNEDNSDKR